MSNYGDQFMKCPECGGVAEAECVDAGVGLCIKDEYECSCGYNSAAEGRANVATYDDWFPDDEDTEPVCVNAHDRCYGDAGGQDSRRYTH